MTNGKKASTNKANPAQSKKKNSSQASSSKRAGKPGIVLSDCSRKYGMVLQNPEEAFRRGIQACVPDQFCFPSLKRAFKLRGSATIGAGGVGYVLINPYSPTQTDNVINSSSSTLMLASAAISTDDGVGMVKTSLPTGGFAGGGFSDAVNEWRVVGCGIKLYYSGTALNRNGVMTKFHAPHNDNLTGAAVSALLTEPYMVPLKVTDRPHTALWKPEAQTDVYFSSLTNKYRPCTGFIMQGEADTEFTWEAYFFYELIGTDYRAVGGVTASESDVTGFTAIGNVMARNPNREPKSEKSFFKEVADAFLGTTSYVYDNAESFSKAANVLTGVAQTAGALLL